MKLKLMNLIHSALLALAMVMLLCRRWTLVGNDAEEPLLANAAEGGSPFAILQDNSFVIPYGDFPHKQGLQKFDRVAAEKMVANHKGVFAKIKSWARGESATYPVYVGHPDLPGSKDTDKRAYGWIENMRAEDDGLHLEVKWSDEGRKLVENAHFKFYSPLWWSEKVRGGIRPVALKSMGLTNDPNIPVPALANEADEAGSEEQGAESEETQDDKTQDAREEEQTAAENEAVVPMEVCEALGLAENAAPADVLVAIRELQDARDGAVNALETFRPELVAAQNERDQANSRVTLLETSLRIVANDAVQAAVKAGRLTPADAAGKLDAVLAANDMEAALAELHALPVKMKTESKTGDLGGKKSQLVVAANDANKADREERARMVENEMASIPETYSPGERKRRAWQKAAKKNPELFSKKESSGPAA